MLMRNNEIFDLESIWFRKYLRRLKQSLLFIRVV